MLQAVSHFRALPPSRATTLSSGILYSEGEVSASSPTSQKPRSPDSTMKGMGQRAAQRMQPADTSSPSTSAQIQCEKT